MRVTSFSLYIKITKHLPGGPKAPSAVAYMMAKKTTTTLLHNCICIMMLMVASQSDDSASWGMPIDFQVQPILLKREY